MLTSLTYHYQDSLTSLPNSSPEDHASGMTTWCRCLEYLNISCQIVELICYQIKCLTCMLPIGEYVYDQIRPLSALSVTAWWSDLIAHSRPVYVKYLYGVIYMVLFMPIQTSHRRKTFYMKWTCIVHSPSIKFYMVVAPSSIGKADTAAGNHR